VRGQATTLKELNDKEEMNLIGFIGNLKIHEMEENLERRRYYKRRKFFLSNLHLLSLTKKMKIKRMMKTYPS